MRALFCLLLTVTFAATSRADDTTLQVLRVFSDWRTETVTAKESQTQNTVLGYWAWSTTTAPQRFSADESWPSTLPATAGQLEIRVGDGRSPLPTGVELLAAPVRMWEEVPEAAIPAWPVPRKGTLRLPRTLDEAWRLRLVGQGIGGPWVEVQPGKQRVSLRPELAGDRPLRLLDAVGEPAGDLALRFFAPGVAGDAKSQRAVYLADVKGQLILPSLPDDLAIELVILAPRHAPLSFAGRLSSLPDVLRLAPGAMLAGRLVDETGQPVAGARVHAIAFLSTAAPRTTARSAQSSADGRWQLDGLAPGETQLTVKAEGFARITKVLDLMAARQELGTLTLEPASTVELRVTDPDGQGIAGAEVKTAQGRQFATDAKGLARLTELPPKSSEKATVSARGFLPTSVELVASTSQPLAVVLEPCFRAVGRLVDAEGKPLGEGRATLWLGARSQDQELRADGTFELEMPPGLSSVVVLSSPQAAELRLTLTPGTAGEVRDLGDLQAPPSLAVLGRLIAYADGQPIAGARVWAVRTADDPLFAFARGDFLEARSDTAGNFVLRGLVSPNALLRIDAPSLARRYLEVSVPDDEPSLDVGTIELQRGSDVIVRLGDADAELQGLEARLDLRGAWLESDMLAASVVSSIATFTHVPAGPATVSVMRGHELVCDREIEVLANAEPLEVDCRQEGMAVHGEVLMGEMPVGPGRLTWSLAGSRAPALIMKNQAGALAKTSVYWGGRPDVMVPVDASGFFTTTALRAGQWSVVWADEASGSLAGPLEVRLVDALDQELILRLPLLAIAGTVVDSEGRGVADARVRELAQGAFAITNEGGAFRLAGLEPGALRLQARLGEASSEVESLELTADDSPPAVRLELVERHERAVFWVTGQDGAPVSGAFLFIEGDGEPLRLLSADLAGRLEVLLHPPYPGRVRAAAFASGRWVFGDWVALETAREGIGLELASTSGGIELQCEEACGALTLRSATGWDLTAMSLRLGRRLVTSAEAPLTLAGLPEGSYVAMGEAWQESFVVEDGKLATVRAP